MEILKFTPLLKQTLWGGDRIKSFKQIDTPLDHIGESWELSGVAGNETVVASGTHQGKTLNQLVAEMKEQLVGRETYQRYGDCFPLLFKFIDARDDLSIQVHPDDATAHRHGKPSGKTEMWYVLPSAPGAHLYSGLSQQITPEEYEQRVASDTITDVLAHYDVSGGDVFFIPAGRIHSIGAGCMIAEIQQTSDVTYRIYDFNRRDSQGNLRQLHTREAAESIDYKVYDDYRTAYEPQKNKPVQLVKCPYFTTYVYDLEMPLVVDYSDLDSFVVLMAIKGSGTLTLSDSQPVTLHAGETVLIPATARELIVEGTICFLEVFV